MTNAQVQTQLNAKFTEFYTGISAARSTLEGLQTNYNEILTLADGFKAGLHQHELSKNFEAWLDHHASRLHWIITETKRVERAAQYASNDIGTFVNNLGT